MIANTTRVCAGEYRIQTTDRRKWVARSAARQHDEESARGWFLFLIERGDTPGDDREEFSNEYETLRDLKGAVQEKQAP